MPKIKDPANYAELRLLHKKKIDNLCQKLDLYDAEGADEKQSELVLKKLLLSVQISEECHLKEKLCVKRALTLCRSLLKHSAKKSSLVPNIIDSCQHLV